MAGNSNTCDSSIEAARLIQEAVQLLLNGQTQSNPVGTATTEPQTREGHTGQGRSVPSHVDGIRNVSNQLLGNSSNLPQPSTSRSDFVQANLSRLFQPYRQPIARRSTLSRRSYETPWTHEFFCLADPKIDIAPTLEERSILQKIGLGKQKITFTNNNSSSYTELSEQLISAYPLLKEAGGFKLMRCGRNRTLIQIPVPSSGYSVKYLRCESNLNKALAYIVPLQQALYIDEEPEVKAEVAVENCRMCHKQVPVHILEEHVSNCSGTVVDLTEDQNENANSPGLVSETENDLETFPEDYDTSPQTSSQAAQVQTPHVSGLRAGCLFTPLSDILLDSDSEEDLETLSSPPRPYSPADDEDDPFVVLSNFRKENISQEVTLTVVVRRKRVLQSAIATIGKAYFAWYKRPQVEFVGELAEDYGGPTREFLRFRTATQNLMLLI